MFSKGKRPQIVVALGGNALSSGKERDDFKTQMEKAKKSAYILAQVIKKGYKVAITHGNGPQVGNILLQQEISKEDVPAMPLAICGAQSQAQIGTMLAGALNSQLKKLKLKNEAVTIITHVLVNPKDPAFLNPTKPIGPFYTPLEAKRQKKEGMVLKKIMAGAFRRVVASPRPLEIIELEVINDILERKFIPIAVGGGGIPVAEEKGILKYVDAVIDKDLASQILANALGADELVILTDVKGVALNFKKPNQKWLKCLNLKEAENYLKVGQFQAGSMGPKIQAAINFLENGGKKAIIAHLYDLLPALKEKAGTVIIKETTC